MTFSRPTPTEILAVQWITCPYCGMFKGNWCMKATTEPMDPNKPRTDWEADEIHSARLQPVEAIYNAGIEAASKSGMTIANTPYEEGKQSGEHRTDPSASSLGQDVE